MMSIFEHFFIVHAKQLGAPNENTVQNHLNNAMFYARYRHIFTPLKFFIYSDFLAESLVIRKL